MTVYHGLLDGSHLRAAIRLALRAHGFSVSRTHLDHSIEAERQLGESLRDRLLPERFPAFVDVADYQSIATVDPHLWDRLPHMLGFGYQQAVVLNRLMICSPDVDQDVAVVGAAFSAGIALIDYCVDEQADGTLVFEMLNRDLVRLIFAPTAGAEAAFAGAYSRVSDPRLRSLCALVWICAHGFSELYSRSRNDAAWKDLARLISQLYESERAVSVATVTGEASSRDLRPLVEAKSVLPFVAMYRIVSLATPELETSERARRASMTLGQVVSLIDDLVDLLEDCSRGAPNIVASRLADRLAVESRTEASDADLYEMIDITVADVVDLLTTNALGIDDTTDVIDFARLTVARWAGWEDEVTASPHADRVNGGEQQSSSIIDAIEMLLTQQRDGYQEAVHRLRLPRIYPEGLRLETYPALLFQRAIVLDGLLDAYAAGYSVLRQLLESEAFAILRAKHRHVRGGWNYIPEVPELPPDSDDLGIVVQVLCRVGGPALASTCDDAIQLALATADPDGGIQTWILDPNGRSRFDEAMRAYIEVIDGRGAHPDVVGNLLYGLLLYDRSRYQNDILRSVAYLEAVQDEQGVWLSRWYAGPYYGTYRVVSAIGMVSPESDACRRARMFFLESQRGDGSWGEGRSDPLATALSLLALRALGMHLEDKPIDRGVTWLISTQETDGGWPASPFIAFPTSDGVEMHTYGSRTMTTTFCLKALLSVSSNMQDHAGILSWANWTRQPLSQGTPGSGWS